jgi:RNA-directed DNA polymerase
MRNRQAEQHVQAVLAGIANRARVNRKHRFGGLYDLLNEEALRWSFYNLNRKAAPGVDEVTWAEYESNLDENLRRLVERLKRKAYRARLVRRHYIPKENGKRRPLGIPVLEDKLVQYAGKMILEAIYEADFYGYSFAYRPERGAKDAVREMAFRLQFGPFGWVVDADVVGFFDNMNHDWMIRMLNERIDDRAFTGLILKWLKAGVLEDMQTVTHPATGTPQGGVISPILANIYLHYALDMWFQKRVQKQLQGKSVMMRYADDFVSAFQLKADAEQYLAMLKERLAKFGLALSEEKTRMVKFTRHEIHRNESFSFLGFEFRWGLDRNRRPHVKRRTMRARLRRALREMAAWIKAERSAGIRPIMRTLAKKLLGHWNYYGVHCNSASLWEFYKQTCKVVFTWLNRCSQRRSYSWDRFNALLARYAIPKPRIVEPTVKRRFAMC